LILIFCINKTSKQISETDVQKKFHVTEVLRFKITVGGLQTMSQDNQFLGSDLNPDPPYSTANKFSARPTKNWIRKCGKFRFAIQQYMASCTEDTVLY
jgi:hypothetical protein